MAVEWGGAGEVGAGGSVLAGASTGGRVWVTHSSGNRPTSAKTWSWIKDERNIHLVFSKVVNMVV